MSEFTHFETGSTNLYAVIGNNASLRWSTTTDAFEELAVANWGNYKIALTETPAGSYRYTFAIPVEIVSPTILKLFIYEQAGGSPAVSDTLLASAVVDWTGSAIVTTPVSSSVGQLATAVGVIDTEVGELTTSVNTILTAVNLGGNNSGIVNAVTISIVLRFTKGNVTAEWDTTDVPFTVTGENYHRANVTIGTSEVLLDKGAADTYGYVHLRNRSLSATIFIRFESGGANGAEIRPGETSAVRIPSSGTPYLVASEAGAVLEYLLLED